MTLCLDYPGEPVTKSKSVPHPRQITMPAPHHSVFTGQMPFLLPNQQHQSTEGKIIYLASNIANKHCRQIT